jgi:hypothetical protein
MKEIMIEKEIIEKQGKLAELKSLHQSILQEIKSRTSELNDLKSSKGDGHRIGIGRPCSWDCNGFLYNERETNGQCGVCFRRTCLECNISIQDVSDHVCKQEDIDSWEHIKKTTKPCPRCATFIHRIEGCSQMWCTQCHTAFDYITGRVETQTGRIHNPHYYEWIYSSSRNNVAPHNPQCQEDQLIHIGYVTQICYRFPPSCVHFSQVIYNHHRLLVEFQHTYIQKVRDILRNTHEAIKRNAKKFIQNEIIESTFSTHNANLLFKQQRITEYLNIMTTFLSTQIDIFNRHFTVQENVKSVKDIQDLIQSLQSSVHVYNITVENLTIKYIHSYILYPFQSDILDIQIPLETR